MMKLLSPSPSTRMFTTRTGVPKRFRNELGYIGIVNLAAASVVLLLTPVFHNSSSAQSSRTLTQGDGLAWQSSAEIGRESSAAGSFPWYDEDEDRIRKIDQPPSGAEGETHRKSDWVNKPWDWNWGNGNRANIPTGIGSGLQIIMWVAIISTAVILVSLLVWIFMRRQISEAQDAKFSIREDTLTDAERVQNLPFVLDRPDADFLQEARGAYEQADYKKAIVYLFSYMLIQLDKNHRIRLTRGKTNRQYLWEVRRDRPLVKPVEQVMTAFEDVFFGDLELPKSEIDSCWQGLDHFQEHLKVTAER